MDGETRSALRQAPGLQKLVPYSAVLDFYGGHISIRSGRVQAPGGAAAESAWKDLVGVGRDAASDFVLRLVSKDKGWLAVSFDGLARTSPAEQSYFATAHRLRADYEALRGS